MDLKLPWRRRIKKGPVRGPNIDEARAEDEDARAHRGEGAAACYIPRKDLSLALDA